MKNLLLKCVRYWTLTFEQGLCLPSGSNMTEDQQERVIGKVLEVLQVEKIANLHK